MIKEGTIIVLSKESLHLRPELRGCQAQFVRDYDEGRFDTAYLYIMSGEYRGREMQGLLRKEDYSLFVINKGKEI